MRLLLLYLGRNGAGPIYSIEYAKALLKKKIDICVIISSYSENIEEWRSLSREYTEKQFSLNEIYTYRSKKEFLIRSLNIRRYFIIVKKIKQYSPDFIISTMVHPWHNIIFLLLKNTIKRIKIIHDVKPHLGEDSLAYRILNWADIHITDYQIVLTKIAQEQLINSGINKSNIGIIPHANFACYSSARIDLPNKIYYRIAFLGRINKYKGLNVLLDAFQQVKMELPNLKLLIAGNGDCNEYLLRFDKLKESLELDLRWIPDEEIQNKIKNVDIVVLPYLEASQSGVIPLAFAFGRMVIATEVGGIPEQVPNQMGILVPPNNSAALKDAILKLYKTPSLIRTMGENAFNYANTVLTWENSADLLLKFCKQHI